MGKDSDLIMGINTITEVMKSHRDKIIKVFTLNPTKTSQIDRKTDLIAALENEGIPIIYLDKKKLEEKAGSDSHQGFVASVKREYISLKQVIDEDPSFLLMLDQIYDPHNFGAILRAAECFNVPGVIYSKNKGCPVTPVVSKVSSGASELVPLVRVSNLHDSLLKLQDSGYSIVVADCSEDSKSIHEFEVPEKMVFILGSEEKGVQALLKKKADHLVHIPMMGRIDSLNVSQAAACFLFYFKCRG